jgi:phenylpyruvate tautomerase PptA (4-oxalocrotonate tautomerase family)
LIRETPDVEKLLAETSRAAAKAFSVPEKQCWATFRPIEPGTYYEGGKLRYPEEAPLVSPLVTVSAYEGRSGEQKAELLRGVAKAVGDGLGTNPDNVFVEYREISKGDVFTGGKVR